MPPSYGPFLVSGAVLCGIMAVVWAFRIKERGIRALPMMLAALLFGAFLLVLRTNATREVVIAFVAPTFVLFALDAMMRAAEKKETGE